MNGFNPKDIRRFMFKIQKTNNCWLWLGCTTSTRYGRFNYNGKIINAHRFSYELFKESIPNGLHIDHLCRNPQCVNPEHLEAVTNKENILRGISIVAQNARKTHCKKGHELTDDNLLPFPLKRGARICKQCNHDYMRVYRVKYFSNPLNRQKQRLSDRKSRLKERLQII